MYSRIPQRFLLSQQSQGSQSLDEDGLPETLSGEGTPNSRSPLRAALGWSQSPSVSQAFFGLNLLTSLQSGHTGLPLLRSLTSPCPSPLSASTPSLVPAPSPATVSPRSVLHPDNQRALARQGYYGDKLPEGMDPAEVAGTEKEEKEEREEEGRGQQKAEDRRKLFHKTRSRAQNSLQERDQGGKDSSSQSAQDTSMRSMTYSTTTESTDSADVMASPVPMPRMGSVDKKDSLDSERAAPFFPMDRVVSIDDLYLPHRDSPTTRPIFRQYRRKLTKKLMSDLDNDDDYDVSPVTSRQPTVERSGTGSGSSAARRAEGSTNNAPHSHGSGNVNGDPAGQSGSVSSNSTRTGESRGTLLTSDHHQNEKREGPSVVKTAGDRQTDSGSDPTVPESPDRQPCRSGNPGSSPGSDSKEVIPAAQTSPSVAAVEDAVVHNSSGSVRQEEHTAGVAEVTTEESSFKSDESTVACDHACSTQTSTERADHDFTSGSAASSEGGSESVKSRAVVRNVTTAGIQGASARVVTPDNERSQLASGGSELTVEGPSSSAQTVQIESRQSKSGESGIGSEGGRGREKDTMLYVYHHHTQLPPSRSATPRQGDAPQPDCVIQVEKFQASKERSEDQDEELPRMNSLQSDSSGFGDVEISTENVTQDTSSLKVSSMGGSCDSSTTTMTSTSTVRLTNDGHIASHNSADDLADSPTSHSFASPFEAGSVYSRPKLSQSTSDLRSDMLTRPPVSSGRFVSMCYIPARTATGPSDPPLRRDTASSQASSSPTFKRDGDPSRVSKSEIRVVLDHRGAPGGVVTSQLPKNDDGKSVGASRHGTGVVQQPWKHYANASSRVHETQAFYGTSGPGRGITNEPRKGINTTPLSEELALASSQGGQVSSSPRVSGIGSPAVVPTLAVQRATLDSTSVDSSRETGEDTDREDRRLEMVRGLHQALAPPSPAAECVTERVEAEWAEGSSVCSGMSATNSIASSGSHSDLLDCQKLIRLINQPTVVKGRKTRLVHYKPKHHLREWPSLHKKKRLREETRLVQYAVQKFKTELGMMDTAAMLRYHAAFHTLTPEEREDVEELQHLWSELRRQTMETERLLTSRLNSVTSGNDCFTFLSSINVLQKMTDLLREQHFQRQLAATDDENEQEREMEEEDYQEEEEEEWRRASPRRYWRRGSRFPAGSWDHIPPFPFPPPLRGRYSVSTTHLARRSSSPRSHLSMEQLRSSLLSEVRQEMRSSLQSLQQDLRERDSEIHRLQQQLLLQKQQHQHQHQHQPQHRTSKKSKSPRPQSWSVPTPMPRSSRRTNTSSKETEI